MRDLTIIVLEVPKYSLIAVITISYGKRIQQARFPYKDLHQFAICVFHMYLLLNCCWATKLYNAY